MLDPKLFLFFLPLLPSTILVRKQEPRLKKIFKGNTSKTMSKTRRTGDAKRNATHTYLKKFTILVKLPDIIIIKDIADVNSSAGEGVRHRT